MTIPAIPSPTVAPPSSVITRSASFIPPPRPPATATPASPSPTVSPWPTSTPFANEATLEVVGQIGGPANAVAVKDKLVYLGVGPQVLVLDVSDIHAPKQIGQSGPLPDSIQDIAVADNLVYVAAGEAGLCILDLSNPTKPRAVGFARVENSAHRVIVQDGVAFVAASRGDFQNRRDTLRLIDVTAPSAPREITWLEGRMVDIQDGYTYIDQEQGLQIFDVSNPHAVRKIANTGIQNVSTVAGGYAYTVNNLRDKDDSSGVLGVVNISNPDQPQALGSWELGHGWPERLDNIIVINDSFVCAISVFHGESAYTVSALDLVDVSNPAELRSVVSWGPKNDISWKSGEIVDTALVDGLLYVALSDTYADNGLWMVNVNDPTRPHGMGSFNIFSDAHDIVRKGEYAYVTTGYFPDYLNLVDITYLNNIQDRGIVAFVDWGGMAKVDDYLYLTDHSSSKEEVHVLDITNPDNPRKLTETIPGLDRLFYLRAADNYACIATTPRRLVFYDLADPLEPRQISQLDTAEIHQVVCAGNRAYYVDAKYEDDFSTLHIVDVSDLANPSESSTINLPKYVRDIAFTDKYLYLIACNENCQGSELLVIDVSEKTSPRQVGALRGVLGSYGTDISLMNDYAYIADGNVWVIDISDPTVPHPAGYLETPGNANAIAAVDDTLLVANGYGGLLIVRVRD